MVALALLRTLAGCEPEPEPPPPPPPNGEGAPVHVTDTGQGLSVRSHTSQPVQIRVAFVVPEGSVCNPYGHAGNREVPFLPGDTHSPVDQALPPFTVLSVPAASCPGYSGYSVWARTAAGGLVFEEHR